MCAPVSAPLGSRVICGRIESWRSRLKPAAGFGGAPAFSLLSIDRVAARPSLAAALPDAKIPPVFHALTLLTLFGSVRLLLKLEKKKGRID